MASTDHNPTIREATRQWKFQISRDPMEVPGLPGGFSGVQLAQPAKATGAGDQAGCDSDAWGEFLRAQAVAALWTGAERIKVAMFDELDEGTAIFKTSSSLPVGDSPFVSEPEVASENHLNLTGKIGQLVRGQVSLE